MDLIDKENIAGIQIGQQSGQIAGFFNGRAGGDADVHAHFIGNDTGQGGLAQTGRAIQKGMIQRLVSQAGGLNINRKIALGLFLTGIVGQKLGPQANLPRVLRREGGGNDGGGIQFIRKL